MPTDGGKGVELRGVEYRVLGPVTVSIDGHALKLGGPRPQTVLAILLCNVNRTVPQDQLIDLVWQGDPPEAARATLQSYIYGLRREVAADVIIRQGDGYRIDADADSYDALRFEQLVVGARRLVGVDPEAALVDLTSAMSLWFGTPFAGLDGNSSLVTEIARLDALRLHAVEHRIDARLALGDQAGSLAELDTLVREHPLRERFRAQQMVALYRSGRQAEALRAFHETRRYLAEELGIEPSAELRLLEQRILAQDPELDGPRVERRARILHQDPQVLRGYELRDVIGTGACGVVHRAFQPSVGREVAVKVIRQEYANDPAFVRHFEREARIVAQLEHPHVVPLFDFWRDPGGAYVVMPYLRGGSLAHALDKGAWQVEPAIQLIQQVGSALAYAHRRGVVHRDLKAANVLLDEEDNAYLTDFAIATIGATADCSESSGGIVVPELSAGGEHSPSSDQFCLAVLAHQVLTGVPPNGLLPLPPITDVRPGLGSDLADVLARATSPSPAERYPTVDAFLRSLRRSVGLDVIAIADPTGRRTDVTMRNPYKGLRSFHESDSADFFGRDGVVAELHGALALGNVVTIVGPSGCGKSSLVRAGLVPSLRAGAIPGSRSWLFADMYPGTRPLEELALALLAVAIDRPADLVEQLHEPHSILRVVKQILPAGDGTLLLVVDQFEELFSLTGSDHVRELFLDAIVEVAGASASPVKIVLTLRADFFDRPLALPALREAIAPGVVVVGPPSRDGMTQAIVGPARAVGLDVEPGLVARILADVERQPAALPLMQFALAELFDARSGDALTIADYDATGGIVGSLGRRAEALYAQLGDDTQDAAAHLFPRLVAVEDGSPDTRRRVRLAELRSLNVDQGALGEVLHRFGASRLLTFDRDSVSRGATVEIAHEAVITEWTRLASWLEDRHDALAQARQLRRATQEWEQSDRDPSFLLRGGRLDHVGELVDGGGAALTADEMAFLDASRLQEKIEQRSIRRRRRRLAAATAVGVAIVAGLGIVAFVQRETALRRSRAAAAARIIADAEEIVDSDPDLALLLGLEVLEGTDRSSDDAVRSAALDVLAEATRAQRVVFRDVGASRIVDVSPDGQSVVLADATDVRMLDVATGEQIDLLAGDRTVTDAEFDPASRRVAVSYLPAMLGEPVEVTVWDHGSDDEPLTLTVEDGGRGSALSWSPDGSALAILSRSSSGRVSILDVASGAETHRIEAPTARGIAFVDDGSVALGLPSEQAIGLWDLTTSELREIETPGLGPSSIDVDALLDRVAVVGRDPLQLQLLDVSRDTAVWSTYLPQPATPSAPTVAVDVEDRQVAVSSSGSVVVHDVDSGREIVALDTNGSPVVALDFGGRGHRLAGVTGRGDAIVWDTRPHGADAIEVGSGPPCGVTVSPDGRRVLTTGSDGTMTVLDVTNGHALVTIPGQQIGFGQQVTVSRDWTYMAWVDERGETWVRDATTAERLVQLPDCLVPKAFSVDGSMLAVTRGCDGEASSTGAHGVLILDASTGREIAALEGREIYGRSAAFFRVPDMPGQEFLVADIDGEIRIHEVPSGDLVAAASVPLGEWQALAVDADGRHLAASRLQAVEVFELARLVAGTSWDDARLATVDVRDAGAAIALDGHGRLATGTADTVRVVDYLTDRVISETGVSISTPPFLDFGPDGGFVVYADAGDVVRRHDLEPSVIVERARARVTRPLTETECLRYLGRPCT